jgi:hypothetical protein
MMSIIYYVREGEMMPFGHCVIGVCHSRFDAVETTLFPLNYLVRLWYWILRVTRPSAYDFKVQDMVKNAYELGRQGKSMDELVKLLNKTEIDNQE